MHSNVTGIMKGKKIENINIQLEQQILTPNELKKIYPLSKKMLQTVSQGQQTVKAIINGSDQRKLVIVGPCSIHDIKAAKEYALKLKGLAEKYKDTLFIVMRVYFEKPRTTIGWEGLINDPDLDNSCRVEKGLKLSRELLSYIAEIGLPTAGEALDIVTPPYIQDLFSWTAIGARTTESQSHRKMASALSAAVGFKNGTDGNIDIATSALKAVAAPHNFISINPDGQVSVVRTLGNKDSHIILRGGKEPNYESQHIAAYEKRLEKAGLKKSIMIDCSHANSNKKADNQKAVLQNVGQQIKEGNSSIIGVMIESNLQAGNQIIPKDLSALKYGISVTDECIEWDDTERILDDFVQTIATKAKKCI